MKHFSVLHLLTQPKQRVVGLPPLLYRLTCTRTKKVWALRPCQPADALGARVSHRRGEKDHCILPAQTAPALLYKPTLKHSNVLLWGHLSQASQKSHVFFPLSTKTIHLIQSGHETLSSPSEAAFSGKFVWKPILISLHNISFSKASVLWFGLNWQQRTTQLLSHSSSLPGGMGRRIRRKKGKTQGLGWEQFNRMAKGEENNNQ